jgi:hypothetical protein
MADAAAPQFCRRERRLTGRPVAPRTTAAAGEEFYLTPEQKLRSKVWWCWFARRTSLRVRMPNRPSEANSFAGAQPSEDDGVQIGASADPEVILNVP